ncbi:MAG: haloacid dehalogenase-like hydrolase [Verrucomicrobia bacterium]|nr:haloacid dehalogenase-like hydrolase [Verrucomicrobiota bacterium]
MPKRLLLFDIDGTLVNTGGAGVVSLRKMVEQRFGVRDELRDIEIAGKTDRAIIRDILHKYSTPATEENIAEFARTYIDGLAEELPRCRGRVLPGVAELLERLRSQPGIVLALLTGNLRRGAELKLRHYRLWQYFEFGAFADDHHDRNELGAFARRRAQEKHGDEFDSADIDVIGDTGHDVACGKAFAARTIAVATGGWSPERLAKCAPDFLFDDFAAVNSVIARLGW